MRAPLRTKSPINQAAEAKAPRDGVPKERRFWGTEKSLLFFNRPIRKGRIASRKRDEVVWLLNGLKKVGSPVVQV